MRLVYNRDECEILKVKNIEKGDTDAQGHTSESNVFFLLSCFILGFVIRTCLLSVYRSIQYSTLRSFSFPPWIYLYPRFFVERTGRQTPPLCFYFRI